MTQYYLYFCPSIDGKSRDLETKSFYDCVLSSITNESVGYNNSFKKV